MRCLVLFSAHFRRSTQQEAAISLLYVELLALLVGLVWAIGNLLAIDVVRVMGGLAFNRWRMTIVGTGLLVIALLAGSFEGFERAWLGALLLSGLVGIFLGDTLLFTALARLGPRRTAMLFSTNAPLTALMGSALGINRLDSGDFLGIAMVIAGVLVAILFGKRRSQLHQWESVRGPLLLGVLMALGAALCQASGTLIAADVMQPGEGEAAPSALAASALRVTVSALCLQALGLFGVRAARLQSPLSVAQWSRVAGSGIIGMGLGMTLLLAALSLGAEAGVVAALSATTPVWLLPLLWGYTRERPAHMAWLGAALAVVGSAIILVR